MHNVQEQIIEAVMPLRETQTSALRWFFRQRLSGFDNKTALELVREWRGNALRLHTRQLPRYA